MAAEPGKNFIKSGAGTLTEVGASLGKIRSKDNIIHFNKSVVTDKILGPNSKFIGNENVLRVGDEVHFSAFNSTSSNDQWFATNVWLSGSHPYFAKRVPPKPSTDSTINTESEATAVKLTTEILSKCGKLPLHILKECLLKIDEDLKSCVGNNVKEFKKFLAKYPSTFRIVDKKTVELISNSADPSSSSETMKFYGQIFNITNDLMSDTGTISIQTVEGNITFPIESIAEITNERFQVGEFVECEVIKLSDSNLIPKKFVKISLEEKLTGSGKEPPTGKSTHKPETVKTTKTTKTTDHKAKVEKTSNLKEHNMADAKLVTVDKDLLLQAFQHYNDGLKSLQKFSIAMSQLHPELNIVVPKIHMPKFNVPQKTQFDVKDIKRTQ